MRIGPFDFHPKRLDYSITEKENNITTNDTKYEQIKVEETRLSNVCVHAVSKILCQ